MRITIIFLILPCFFNVLLASPLPGKTSLPLRRRLHDTSRLIARADRAEASPDNPTFPRPTFEECSADQQIELTKAVHHAATLVKNSLAYLEKYREVAPRFEKWFNKPDHERWKTLRTLLQDIDKYILHGVYDCGECSRDKHVNPKINAYIYHKELGRVYICPPFWKRPLVGPHSQGGIIVHEWSHFYDIGGTQDHDKTRKASQHLASWNPDLAIENSYSVQFFAENDPHLD